LKVFCHRNRFGMVATERLLMDRQRALEKRPGAFEKRPRRSALCPEEFALCQEKPAEFAQAHRGKEMVRAEHLLVGCQRALEARPALIAIYAKAGRYQR
jgi:hypothetical protein